MPWRDITKYPICDKRCTVYLIHFDKPFGHAQHYVGVCKSERDVQERFREHGASNGSRLCRAAVQAGVKLMLARVWLDVPRYFELKLKGRGKRKLCPICQEQSRLDASDQSTVKNSLHPEA